MSKKTILSFQGEEHELKPVGHMNKQTLWLARDMANSYELFTSEPNIGAIFFFPQGRGKRVVAFCPTEWEQFCPSLTLAPGQKIKVELTEIDGGIRLERL